MPQDAEVLGVERLGGLAGYGGPGAHLRSRGQLRLDSLSAADRKLIDELFAKRGAGKLSAARDAFTYRISRAGVAGVEIIDAPESAVPPAVAGCVRDELA